MNLQNLSKSNEHNVHIRYSLIIHMLKTFVYPSFLCIPPDWTRISWSFLLKEFMKSILLMAEILHRLIGSLSHYLQGFIYAGWCRISSINSRNLGTVFKWFLIWLVHLITTSQVASPDGRWDHASSWSCRQWEWERVTPFRGLLEE